MNLPFFYADNIDEGNAVALDEDNSRHVVSVLRMQQGEQLHLTDGKGNLLTATIIDPHKKKCRLSITGRHFTQQPVKKTAIGISPVKNLVRFEWFLEKATEIGISEIFPLICSRTEKQHFRTGRMKNVLISAMLQSRQTWLPVLHEPVKIEKVFELDGYQQKFIAHCKQEDKKNLGAVLINPAESQLVLIGPEGDFTSGEISNALQAGFIAVALGQTRLRTETAGILAAALLRNAV
ncbi:MAG TPA: RsmE family RNA methyltransferase [Chitinophagaceae bacterium]|nr:RsmE family RNA methyltransferase [Chitinophagaceae bacterium]